MIILRLSAATLFPVILTGLFIVLERRNRFASIDRRLKQLIIGLAFGGFAILSSEFGVPVSEGVIMNVRDSAPLCAGLIFGGPAGLIAGAIGGVYRWISVYWGGSVYTRLACSLATVLAGVFSCTMRKQLFEGRVPGILPGLGTGATMEVLHMLLVLVTNLSDVSHAFTYVQICSFPMILCNGLALGLAILLTRLLNGDLAFRSESRTGSKPIRYDFGFWLMIYVIIAFLATSIFTQQIVYRVTTGDDALYRNVTLYLVVFMEILIYTALFILIYQMLRKKILYNLQKVNDGLTQITGGDLDTKIDVRSHDEFSELSDHVNATVDTLKRYIREAEKRIDRELELAHQIQQSSLPSVFPPYPRRRDFRLHASMKAAKEVGGDFYDFYMPDDSTLVILIADVSSKGIPAAMFMMRAKTLISGLTGSGRSVDEAFTEANRDLCENNDTNMFITAWMGKIDLRTGLLSFVNAGHNPPLLSSRTSGETGYLHTEPNFVLAGIETTRYRREEIRLHPGDTLFLYTDGVTEAADAYNEMFGEERLKTLLSDISGESPENICHAVSDAILKFAGDEPQADDITMLCVSLDALAGNIDEQTGSPVSL